MIGIIDCGMGNIASIKNMLKKAGADSCILSEAKEVENADKLILPVVGSFDVGIGRIRDGGFDQAIFRHVEKGKPLLGICLGMQLLGCASEEGQEKGLGLIPFRSVRFRFGEDSELKIPHMGWDYIRSEGENPLTEGIDDTYRYYFVHSYHALCEKKENVLFTCEYGYEFAAGVVQGCVYGVQFRPEKSHKYGMKLLGNFIRI